MPRDKKRSTSRPSRARSTSATATRPRSSAKDKQEKGTSILDALYKGIDREVGTHDRKLNKSQTYTRLLVGGKGFGFVFVPRESSVMVRIPHNIVPLLDGKLPKEARDWKKTDWGLWPVLTAASQVPAVAKALAAAADAVRAKEEPEASPS